MKKGRNIFVSTLLYTFDVSTRHRKRVGSGLAAGISAPTPAWTPGLPPRDPSCRCRPLRSRAAKPDRLQVWSRHGAVHREPRGPRGGIGRSLRTRDSNSNSFSSLL